MANLEIVHPPVASIDNLYRPSVMQLARAGNFRAIAYWINTYLVPQDICAYVSAAPRPGHLSILVEFVHAPEPERLIRFICHRLCKLKSDVILGAQITACYAGSSQVLWQRSVRLLVPSQRRHSRCRPVGVRPGQASRPSFNLVKTARTMQSQLNQLQLQEYLNHPRSRLLAKSAAAAFLLGCGVEVVASTLQTPQTVSVDGVTRPAIVEAALEKVPVTQLEASTTDPTVTLAFSNEGALGAVRAQSASGSTSATSNRVSLSTQADVMLAYLNTPPSPSASNAAPSEAIQALQADGVDVVNLANNALLNQDASELSQAINTLEQAGIHSLGAGRNQREARRPEIIDVKGQRIAYLGYSDASPFAANASQNGVDSGLTDQVSTDIQAIRDQVDWVVVNYHWNQELTEQPAAWQVNLAHTAIDQGADLVVGHHPDVLQGAEIYRGRAIAYSLGNFIFPNNDNPAAQADYDTAMLKVSLRQDQMRLEFLPVQVTQDTPQIASGEKAEEILQRIRKASAQFERPMEFPVTLDAQSPKPPAPAVPLSNTQPLTPQPVGADPLLEAPQEQETPPLITQPPAIQPHSLEPTEVEANSSMGEPTQNHSLPPDSFITYPDGAEEIPIENEILQKPDPLVKQESEFTTEDTLQPVDAIPETAEIDILPEAGDIVFPDEIIPDETAVDAMEPLPGDGF